MSDHYVRCNNECTHMCYGWHFLQHGICQIIIFENNIVLVEENVILVVYEGEITADLLLVNLIICILKWGAWKTGYTKVYVRYSVRCNDECTHIFYW
jgi:hypothetical protein